MDLGIQLVDRHPVLEVAIEPVGLLDQDHPHVRMRPQPGHHLAEGAAAGLLGGLDVHILLRHGEALGGGVVLEQLQLRRDRVALLLLLLGGDTSTRSSSGVRGFKNLKVSVWSASRRQWLRTSETGISRLTIVSVSAQR